MSAFSVSTDKFSCISTSCELRMFDDSMMSEFRPNDILVIDPSLSPEPGNYVAVKMSGKSEAIICQYKKLSYTSSEFELLTLNDHWPNIKVIDGVEIVGKVVECIRGV
jgi:SOS-response transcriptional repressor LexA